MTSLLSRLSAILLATLSLMAMLQPASAEPVRITVDGRGLDGNLTLATGHSIRDGVMVLVHGTLAHNRMEIMQALQQTLGERGISTVAVTLSMGVSDRKGMYDCPTPHRHTNAMAVKEIGAWIDWAVSQGAAKIGLLGHSRGGAQVALYAARAGDRLPAALQHIILVAPGTFDLVHAREEYKARYGGSLDDVLKKAKVLADSGKGDTLMTQTGFMYCPNTSVTAETFLDYHNADGRNDAPSQLAAIRRPVLLAVAGADDVVKDLPQRLATAKLPAKYRSITIDGADHFFKDLFGDDLADAIAAFWKE